MSRDYDEIDAILSAKPPAQPYDEIDALLAPPAQSMPSPPQQMAPIAQAVADRPGTGHILPQERTWLGELNDLGVSVSRGMVAVPAAIAGLADMATSGSAGRWLNRQGINFSEIDQRLQQDYSPAQQRANAEVAAAKGAWDTTKAAVANPSTIGHAVAQSMPAMATGGLFGRALTAAPVVGPALAPFAGGIGEGVVAMGGAATQMREASPDKELTGKQALLAGVVGAGTAGISALSGTLANRLGIDDIDQLMAGQRATSGYGMPVLAKGAAGGVFEGAEEALQSTNEGAMQNISEGRPTFEGVPKQAAMGGLTGFAMGAPTGLVGGMARQQQDTGAPTMDEILRHVKQSQQQAQKKQPAKQPASDTGIATLQDLLQQEHGETVADDMRIMQRQQRSAQSLGEPVAVGSDKYMVYVRKRRQLESGGRADAKAKGSSATGIDQFTAGTFLGIAKRHMPDLVAGKSDAEILALRTNPDISGRAAQALDRENAAALQNAGVPVTEATLYAAHHFGPQKAVAFGRAGMDTPMSSILTAEQMRANPYLNGKTKAQALANWSQRAGLDGGAAIGQIAAGAAQQAGAPVDDQGIEIRPAMPDAPAQMQADMPVQAADTGNDWMDAVLQNRDSSATDLSLPNQADEATADSAIVLRSDAFRGATMRERIMSAFDFARQRFAGSTVHNQSDGTDIIIPASGIKHALSGQVSEATLAAVSKLDEVVAKAKFVTSEPDKKGRNTIKEVRFYEQDVSIDGKDKRLRVVVRVAHDGSRYYDHFEIKEKAPAGQSGKRVQPGSLQPFTGAVPANAGADSSLPGNGADVKRGARDARGAAQSAFKGETHGNQRAGQENLEERIGRQPDARDAGHQTDDRARPTDAGATQTEWETGRPNASRPDALADGQQRTGVTAQQNHAEPARKGESNEYASGVPKGLPAAPDADTAKLEQRINRWLAHEGRQGGWRASRVSAASLPDALNHALDRFYDATGTRVVLFRNLTPEIDDFNGVNFRDGILYINENSRHPLTLTAAHEWLHNIRKTHPLLYEALAQEVMRQGDLAGYQQHLKESDEPRWRNPDVVVEELTAAAVSDALTDPEFLHRLAQENQNLFQKVARAFLDFLKTLTQGWRDQGSNRYLQDVGAFRDRLEAVLDLYQQDGNRGGGVSEAMFQRAWHGTPHRGIEQTGFKLNKIGTGEGAQAYGWGMYFASQKEVAEHYRKGLSYRDRARQFMSELPEDADIDEVMQALDNDSLSPATADVVRALANDDWLGFDYPAQAVTAAFRELDSFDPSSQLRDAVRRYGGQLYQVEIPEDSDLLDWDKPLHEQPQKVQKAIEQTVAELPVGLLVRHANADSTLTGRGLMHGIRDAFAQDVLDDAQFWGSNEQKASQYLNSLGIPGLRYLDGNSRADGKGSHNYVIWDEALLTPEAAQIEPMYSRSDKTRAAYEERIDALFAGDAARRGGVRVLDRADILDLIGYGSKPMDVLESKVLKAQEDHPNMKAEHWKKVPEWLDQPAAVFDSDTVDGRLVFVAPEIVSGAPALMAVTPDAQNTGTLKVSLLVSAYDAQGGKTPFGRWVREGLLRYVDKKKFPDVLAQSVGLQLPESAFQNKPGMRKILTEKNLAGWRKTHSAQDPVFSRKEQDEEATFRAPEVRNEQGELLAPNGAVSNLDERQWHQVRSPQFKAWFGDWEHDPENASKVVDENGEPLVVYRADKDAFNAFNRKKAKEGFFFTSSKERAARYGGQVRDFFLNMRNALEVERALPNEKNALDIEAEEHDGVVNIGAYGNSNEYIAAASTQIKSATGNSGAFDGENPDIRFSRQSPQQQVVEQFGAGWDVSQPGRLDGVIRTLQNNKIDLKRTVDAIGKAGGKITDQSDAYLADELYVGRVTDGIEQLKDKQIVPLLEAIAESDIAPDLLERYMHAKHAEERNVQMAKINGDAFDLDYNMAGMSTREGRRIVQEVEGGPKAAEYTKLANMVYAMLRDTRRRLVQNGLATVDEINAWEGAYKYYVPLMRDTEESGGRAQGYNVKGNESRRAVGSKKEVKNILANVVAQAEASIIRSEKARVGRALLQLAKDNPNPDFWKVNEAPTERVINKATGLVEERVEYGFKNADTTLVVKVDGKEQFISFNPDNDRAVALVRNLKNLDVAEIGPVTKIMGAISRYIAQWVTSRNPLFWVTNFARDVQGMMINLQDTPIKGKEAAVFAAMPKAFAAASKAEFGDGGKGLMDQYYREFSEHGGKTGYVKSYKDSVERMGDITKEIARMKQSSADPRKIGRGLLEIIDGANDVVENGVRLAVYATARQNGVSASRAASIAKNITVNFNRRGNQTAVMNSLYMFSNASLQGNVRMLTAVKNSPRARVYAVALAAAGYVITTLNILGGGDDEESRKKRYELVPEFERERSWIVMIPGSDNYVKIPLSQGPHTLFNVGRLGAEVSLLDRKPLDAAAGFLSSVVGSFNPIGGGVPTWDFKGAAQTAAPSAVRPVVDLAVNQGFAGSPISKEEHPFANYHKPKYQLTRANTPEYWKDTAKLLNDWTGGDSVRGGLVNTTPETLAYLVKAYAFPGLAQAADKAGRAMTSDKDDMTRLPGVDRFFGRVDEAARERAAWDRSKQDMQTLEQVERYMSAGEREKAQKLLEEVGDGDPYEGRRILALAERRDKELRAINKRKKAAGKIPDENRRRVVMGNIEQAEARINSKYLKSVAGKKN